MKLRSDLSVRMSLIVLMAALFGGCSEVPATQKALPTEPPVRMTEVIEPIVLEKSNLQMVDSRPYLDEVLYMEGIQQNFSDLPYSYVPLEIDPTMDLVGAIVPHHGPAHVFMADVYRSAGEIHETKPYDLVVVIGPNHYSVGPAIQISKWDFETYSGKVMSDRVTAKALIGKTEAEAADSLMLAHEHSQLIQMPYMDFFLEGVPVLSVTVTESGNAPSVMILAEELLPLIEDRHVLVIGSIDFSHGLPLREAEKRDEITEQYLAASDGRSVQYLRDDHLDAPSSYLLFTELMDGLAAAKPVITNHSNSALILNDVQSENTTSYFQVMYFVE